jgi:electron transport complex protein RnfB
MSDDVYRQLAVFLDNLPGGFPETESGVELRILRRLFDEDEAELAVHLTMRPQTPEVIAEATGMDVDLCAERLETMAKKGLLYRHRREGKPLYASSQFVVGMWEYHVNDLDPDLIRDFNEYVPYLFEENVWEKVPQLRTIPIVESVSVTREVLPHEHAEELVRAQEKLAVAPCICRREHTMMGEGCGRPLETCLVFGAGADYYVENGMGRYIDVDEALEILKIADDAGLVLQPSNSKRIVNICCCCGCCCQVLKTLNKQPKPARLVASPFYAVSDPDVCIGCGDCVERCQMGAIAIVDEVAVIDLDRCIGCGLCVTTCSTESMRLERKPEEEQPPVPTTFSRMLLKLARERGVI